MRRVRKGAALLVASIVTAGLLAVASPVSAAEPLDVRVKSVRAPAAAVSATIEIQDLIPNKFRKLIEDGGVLHLRLQAELWESRPVWDRLVYPAMVRVFRVGRMQPGGDVAIADVTGSATTVVANPLPVTVDLGSRERVTTAGRYYVHVIATLGTLADREAETISDAVFGRSADGDTVVSLGRAILRTALQIGDYLQSVPAETKSGHIAGRDILQK